MALFAGAMFTKETMVCIPVLIAAWLWLTLPKTAAYVSRAAQILRTLLPYGVVWAGYMAIRHKVIKPAAASADYIHPTFTLSNLWTAPYSIWWYLRHLAMPWGLSVEYTPVVIDHPTLRNFFLPAAGLVGLSLAAWWLWRRQRSAVAAFLGFWFVLNLAPPVICGSHGVAARPLPLPLRLCVLRAAGVGHSVYGKAAQPRAAGDGLVRGGSLVGPDLA